jgi:hypothetical protein
MMEAVSSSEMSVSMYQTTRCNISDDSNLHTRSRENLKSHYDEGVRWIIWQSFRLVFEQAETYVRRICAGDNIPLWSVTSRNFTLLKAFMYCRWKTLERTRSILNNFALISAYAVALGGVMVSVLATGPKVRTMDFKGDKIRSTPSFGAEVKPSVPCRRFAV